VKISLHAYAFGPHGGWVPTYLVEEAIKRTAKLGYDGIELDAARPHVWPYDINKEHRVAIKKLVKECNLEVPAISGYYFGMNFSSPLQSEREAATDYLVKCVELCNDLESKVLVVVPGVVVYGTSWKEAWNRSLDQMRLGIRRAEELGVYIGIEFVNTLWSNLVTTSWQAVDFMNECHSDQVKLVLDSSHAFYGGENIVDVVQSFGKDLVHVHFEDCLIGAPETRAVPGKGDVNLISLYQTLKEIGYDGYLTVELWGSQPEKYAREALENTKKIVSCCK